MKCDIKVLSPIHIGSGEKYTASEYVKSKAKTNKGNILNIIKRMDVSSYFSSLDENKKDDLLRDLSNPNFNLGNFDSRISNSYVKYKAIDKTKKEIYPSQEIAEAIKTLNELYIPGSSIKGAIKTAILFNELDGRLISKISKNILSDNGSVIKKNYGSFMNDIFASNKAPPKAPPAQWDIMKFLQVSDTNTIKSPTIYDVATVMASFKWGDNEFYSKNKRTHEPILIYLETIARGKKLSFEIRNHYDYDIFKSLGLDDKKHLIDIKNIKRYIFNFSKSLIRNEIEFSEDYEIDYLNKFYLNLEKQNSIDNPVLRVGGGSGFLATTVDLKIMDHDETIFEKIKKGTRGKTYDYSFPKSRKITQVGGMPLGWIQLSFGEV